MLDPVVVLDPALLQHREPAPAFLGRRFYPPLAVSTGEPLHCKHIENMFMIANDSGHMCLHMDLPSIVDLKFRTPQIAKLQMGTEKEPDMQRFYPPTTPCLDQSL